MLAEWRPAPEPSATQALVRAGLAPRLARLLALRGVADEKSASAFLTPSVDQLHDPFRLAGMAAAVTRLVAAQQCGEAVAVVGDYDVDGVTATALLLTVLRACGLEAHPVLPHRLVEGYGFQPRHVERAQELGARLIVTVDCGTSSAAAIAHAGQAGIDVVVTDHHLPSEGLPAGATVVNPRQSGCDYPFPDLAGVGLALKLAQAVASRLGKELPVAALLRIACLGTIADVVPLRGENRVIAAVGLDELGRTRSVGLQALLRRAGLRPPFTAADVGYRIGPRLNAAGRLASPQSALDLLLARDAARAEELAEELETCNRARQDEEALVLAEARAMARALPELPGLLMLWSASWHRGVVGIAAGRLARELHRPTVLLAVDGEQATGSGRSVPRVDLHGFLTPFRARFVRFGGHAQAVGMTVGTADLEAVRAELVSAAAAWGPEQLRPRLDYELEIGGREIGADLCRELSRLEPFGQSNPQPLLRVGPLQLRSTPRSFGRNHLSGVARHDDGSEVRFVGWGWQERADLLAARFESLATLDIDSYTGQPTLRLVDARPLS